MARRMTPSQIRSELQRIQQQNRQAVNKLKSAAQQFDRDMKRLVDDHNRRVRERNQAINNYNRAARQHNARVRSNQDRLRRELNRLSTSSRTTQRVTFRTSVVTVQQSFRRVEEVAATDRWVGDAELFDLIEGEAANAAATWNTLEGESAEDATDADELRDTRITTELAVIDPDFDHRWRGALYALSPDNPDAARHFCASSRELVDRIIVSSAPDAQVVATLPDPERTPQGSITRRTRLRYCLVRSGRYSPEVHNFADADIQNVVDLFSEFNDGTHGSAGHFSLGQLRVIKRRVEDALLFLLNIIR